MRLWKRAGVGEDITQLMLQAVYMISKNAFDSLTIISMTFSLLLGATRLIMPLCHTSSGGSATTTSSDEIKQSVVELQEIVKKNAVELGLDEGPKLGLFDGEIEGDGLGLVEGGIEG